jgi:hypothetical protein
MCMLLGIKYIIEPVLIRLSARCMKRLLFPTHHDVLIFKSEAQHRIHPPTAQPMDP